MSNNSGSIYRKISSSPPIDDMPNDFDSISIRIASAIEIKDRAKRTACKLRGTEGATWPCPERGKCDCGEVKTAETINFRTFRPEPKGLFCEATFGPKKDWECNCGKYRRIRHKGVICDRCGVEVEHSRVRRERFGYIQLAAPVAHIWFSKSYPSVIGTFCELSSRDVERVLYFEAFIVIEVIDLNCPLEPRQILTETEYIKLKEKYKEAFYAGTGAEIIREILRNSNLEAEINTFKKTLLTTNNQQKKRKITKQLSLYESFAESGQQLEWMIMDVIPVIPPTLRPMRSIGNGRFLTSHLNDLYRNVINRNNRLRKLIQFRSPEVTLRNEKRMLQESVDALFDNGWNGKYVKGPNNRTLKSLSKNLRGKYGRFRQSLLGKRVDYSAISTIVVAPELGTHQCGLPQHMAIKLFEPFIVKKLLDHNYAQTVKRAKYIARHVDADSPVWNVLEDVIAVHPILLNHQPTLHQLDLQAFMPILVEGDAIRIPPLVWEMFNASCDNSKIIVHVPVTRAARIEARLRLLATRNIRKPANGKLITVPPPDAVLGLNFLTKTLPEHTADAKVLHHAYTHRVFDTLHSKPWYGRRYVNLHEVVLTHEAGKLKLHESVQLFFLGRQEPILTTVGRVIFNQILPEGLEWIDRAANTCLPFFNNEVTTQTLTELVSQTLDAFGKSVTVSFLQRLQKLGFDYARCSGISQSIRDKNPGIQESGITDLNSAPVRAAYRDGLEAFTYFREATSVRDSKVNSGLMIQKAFALNKRLVNVASDVVVTEEDCGTREAIRKFATEGTNLAFKINGRIAVEDIKHPITRETLADAGSLITPRAATLIEDAKIVAVKVRSVLTCEAEHGICAKCYGTDLTDGTLVGLGEAIGIIAAQAIGELSIRPLLMPSHTHGGTTSNMAAGVPRLIELFEAPKRKKTNLSNSHDILKTGGALIDGMYIEGEEAAWAYLVNEIQKVYEDGSLNEKHTEVIVRQMSRKIRITEPGDTKFDFNEEIEKFEFHRTNRQIYQDGGTRAKGEPILQGITLAALNTESFLLAASLRHPRKVLTEAAIQGKKDPLSGIRESMMAGKLIPVGPGFKGDP